MLSDHSKLLNTKIYYKQPLYLQQWYELAKLKKGGYDNIYDFVQKDQNIKYMFIWAMYNRYGYATGVQKLRLMFKNKKIQYDESNTRVDKFSQLNVMYDKFIYAKPSEIDKISSQLYQQTEKNGHIVIVECDLGNQNNSKFIHLWLTYLYNNTDTYVNKMQDIIQSMTKAGFVLIKQEDRVQSTSSAYDAQNMQCIYTVQFKRV